MYAALPLASRDRQPGGCAVSARSRWEWTFHRAIVRRVIQKLYGSAKVMLKMTDSVPSAQLWAMRSMRV